MSTQKILLSAGAVILVVVLFLLPKVVVDNEGEIADKSAAKSGQQQASENSQPAGNTANPGLDVHNVEVSEEDRNLLDKLRKNLSNSENDKKSAIFADSLAAVFTRLNRLDSAAKYRSLTAEYVPNQENWLAAGNSNYEAFQFALDAEKVEELGKKTQYYYEKVLAEDPDRLDVKTNLAMTYISTKNPMKGIGMLMDVIKQDPEHEQALFNLGILSIQSNQYDKAVARFEKIVTLYPDNLQAQFFLGVSYYETKQQEKAREQFEKVKKLNDDPAVQASVDRYLEEMD